MEAFRWAYVGCGSIAKNTARNIAKGDHAITAVYSRNREKAEDFAKKHGARAFDSFDAMLSLGEFDAVYVATPHTSHTEYAVRAMEAGRPVLCEKPVGVTRADAETLVAASRENGVYFCEAMWTWFSPVAHRVRDWVREGRIGRVTRVRMEYAFPGVMMSRDSRVLNPETAGGALLDIGIYPVTYCYNLFGYPDRIDCAGSLRGGIDVEETVTLGYEGFDCTLEVGLTRLRESCRIVGERGEISVPAFHMARYASLKTDEGTERFTGKTDYLTEFTWAAEEIRAGRTQSAFVPHAGTLDCMAILDACRARLGLVYPFE